MANVAHNQLSIAKVRSLKDAGRYVDGQGLYLRVNDLGGKAWFLRGTVGGRRREMPLGTYPELSLADAREERDAIRHRVMRGEDPFTEHDAAKRQAQINAITLEQFTRKHFER